MASTKCACNDTLRQLVRTHARLNHLPPAFLIPAFAPLQRSCFSTTSAAAARKDGNPRRGVSALKRSGLRGRFKLSAKLKDLPQPVLDPKKRTQVKVDEYHGLWGFFDADRSPLMTPDALHEHGRAWTVPELRNKSFEDLWKLYWVCIKEVNRIQTYEHERKRLKITFGEYEANERLEQTKKTQKAVRHTLTERWYQFEDARELAMSDPEINLYADPQSGEPAYTPVNKTSQQDEGTYKPTV